MPPSPPASNPIGPINNLALTPALLRSAVTPTAQINATWDPPHAFGYGGQYQIRWSESSSFPEDSTGYADAANESARIDHLQVARTYYVQVVRVERQVPGDWSEAPTASATTPADTTPPSAPASQSAAYSDQGDLVVTFTPSASANYGTTEIAVYKDATKAVLLALLYNATGRAVWTAAQNRQAAQAVGLGPQASVYVELRSRSANNLTIYSASVSATASKARPAAPGSAAAVWDGATGTARWSWSAVADAVAYRLTIDGRPSTLTDLSYSYSAAQNRLDHSGAASASLAWTLVAIDALDQTTATPASGTATLARPATPSGVSVSWDSALGTARWTWTPGSAIAYTLLTIDSTARQLQDSRYDYLVAQNRLEHSGAAVASLPWALTFVDGLGQTSVSSASGTATLAPPDTPAGVTQSWAGDAGTAGADWTIAWSAVATPVASYRLTIDGVARTVSDVRYTYPLATNRQEHSGSPDPALTWSLVAVDGLGQTSTAPASGTATNAAPAAPTISAAGGFSTLGVAITSAAPPDLDSYQVRIISGGSTVATFTTRDVVAVWQATTPGVASYQVAVRAYDVFGQAGAETTSSSFTLDVLTVSSLRAETEYSDSLGTSATTLAALKDDDRATNVVTIAAGTSWRWTQAQRALLERYQNITVAASGGSGYLGVSADGNSWRWYAGPLGSDGRTLTYIGTGALGGAEELSAQTAALSLPTDGVWALPTLAEGRYVRLGHRNPGGTYSLREFYPNTMVLADQIRAGSVTALHVVAASITGDRLYGSDLAALKANLGSVTISGVCSIGAAGGIYQGSAGTFAAPDTGLKIFSSGGMGLWESWGSGVKQTYLGTDGALYAGQGNVRLSSAGLRLIPYSGSINTSSYIGWQPTGAAYATSYASAEYTPGTGISGSGQAALNLSVLPLSTGNTPYRAQVQIQASTNVGLGGGWGEATIRLVTERPSSGTNNPYVQIGATAGGVDALNGELMLRVYKAGLLVNSTNNTDAPRQPLDVRGNAVLDGTLSVGSTLSSTGNAMLNGAMVGVHPLYTTGGRVSVWKNGADQYFVQTDGTDTHLNAPVSSGAVYIRGANSLRATFDPNGHFISSNDTRSGGNMVAGAQTGTPILGRITSVVNSTKATSNYNGGLVISTNEAASPFVLVMALQTDPSGVNRCAVIDVDDAGAKRALRIQPFGGPIQMGTPTSLWSVYGATPTAQTTGGAKTAGTTWTTTERDMLNTLYSMARNTGLIS